MSSTLINVRYLIFLILSWIVSGWILMVKKDSESTYDFVPLHDTLLYQFFCFVPMLAIVVSLIINIFKVGLFSTLCYIGIVIGVQILNINLIYYIYRYLFGRDGLGTLTPLILIIPIIVYMYIIQFS